MIEVNTCPIPIERYLEYEELINSVPYGVNLHPTWINAYVDVYGYQNKSFILNVRDDATGRLRGFLPLVRKDSRESRFVTQRRLVPAGYGPTDFFCIPSFPGNEFEVAAELANWLKRNSHLWDLLTLNLIPGEDRGWRPFVDCMKSDSFNPTVTSDRNFLRIDTTKSLDDYLQALGTEKTKEIRYYRNKLQKICTTVQVEHLKTGLEEYFDKFVQLYTSRRFSKGQSDPYTRVPPLYHFMRKVIPEYEKKGWIRLSLLKLDDLIIAYCYQPIFKNVMYYSMPTFLEEYRSYSPGKVLLMELIRNAFEDSTIREFNFMRSEYDYKLWFCPERVPYVTISGSNPRSLRNSMLAVIRSSRRVKNAFIRSETRNS